jgi:hypothetical protein
MSSRLAVELLFNRCELLSNLGKERKGKAAHVPQPYHTRDRSNENHILAVGQHIELIQLKEGVYNAKNCIL